MFTIECPPTLAMVRVLLVVAGGHTVAIPTESIERIERLDPAQLRRAGGRDVLPGPDQPVVVASLARLLGPGFAETEITGAPPIIRLAVGNGRRAALVVDEALAEEEILIRPLKHIEPASPLASGAALLSSGEVTVLLRPEALCAAAAELPTASGGLTAPDQSAPRSSTLLVVDDSITTRSLERSILEAAGYTVRTSANGAEAWQLLQGGGIDLVISDIEMPEMDGIALCQAVRGSPELAGLPIVLVTALESPEDRQRGMEAGANAYVVKSSFDQADLLEVIRQLLGDPV
jgi:two-component system chemotaxis sensor kinase CheA